MCNASWIEELHPYGRTAVFGDHFTLCRFPRSPSVSRQLRAVQVKAAVSRMKIVVPVHVDPETSPGSGCRIEALPEPDLNLIRRQPRGRTLRTVAVAPSPRPPSPSKCPSRCVPWVRTRRERLGLRLRASAGRVCSSDVTAPIEQLLEQWSGVWSNLPSGDPPKLSPAAATMLDHLSRVAKQIIDEEQGARCYCRSDCPCTIARRYLRLFC
jgi:hypothetical protein